MKKIYISGAMTGHENLNFDQFDRVEKSLSKDWMVINPANMFRALGNGHYPKHEDHNLTRDQLAIVFSQDFFAIAQCDAIYMMKGWEKSKGAQMEKLFAHSCNIQIIIGYE